MPLFYSFAVFIDKFLIEKKIKDPVALTALFGIASGVVGIIIGLITGFKFIGLYQTGLVVVGGMLLLFYLLPYFVAMKMDDVSRVVPLYQLLPVITLILSSVFLKETLTPKQIVGLLIVVIGAISISLQKIEGNIFKPRKSLWLILLSSFMYGCVVILFRFVVKGAPFWSTFSYQYMGTGIAGLILLTLPRVRNGLRKDMKAIKSSVGLIALDKGFGIIAQLSESFAISLVAVPLVNVVESIQPLLILVEGLILTLWFPRLIKENIRKETLAHKFISILLIFFGLYLVNR